MTRHDPDLCDVLHPGKTCLESANDIIDNLMLRLSRAQSDAGQREAQERAEVEPMDWRDGLDALDRLLDDCAQGGDDAPQSAVKVWAVREIVRAVRVYEDETDKSIGQELWEDAVTSGEPWATGDDQHDGQDLTFGPGL